MKITVWLSTNKVGSTCEDEIEIDDEDLEGMDEGERNEAIDAIARETLWNLGEWGWRKAE